ncbi:MAG: YraN family protein [Phycisphaerales bacterium]
MTFVRRLWQRLCGVEVSLGERGERLAARWLTRHGYRILHRNLTIGRDEADLVAVDPGGRTLVIVEVKTRSSATPPPEAGLTRAKQRHLERFAARLRRRRKYRDLPVRIDAIAIVWPEGGKPDVRHYESVFSQVTGWHG